MCVCVCKCVPPSNPKADVLKWCLGASCLPAIYRVFHVICCFRYGNISITIPLPSPQHVTVTLPVAFFGLGHSRKFSVLQS